MTSGMASTAPKTSDASQPCSSLPHSSTLPASTVVSSPAINSAAMRACLRHCIAALGQMRGFESIQPTCLETLTHLTSSYMTAICLSSKMNTEVAGRTITIPGDVWLALVNMGHKVDQLPEYLSAMQRSGCVIVPSPKMQTSTQLAPALHVGHYRPHPAYVNEFLPAFPDPHTYIKTDIMCEPDGSYERVRELAASSKRDVESTLVSFMLRLHPHYCLFPEYDQKVKQAAMSELADRDRRKELGPTTLTVRQASNSNSAMSFDEHDLLEDMDADEGPSSKKAKDGEISMESEETLTSLVRKRIPFYSYVLEPSHETRAYLSVLVTDEAQEDELQAANKLNGMKNDTTKGGNGHSRRHEAATVQRTNGHDNQPNGETHQDEQAFENLYLQPPRLPTKT